jgi:K+-sensing histidine kinase KdpD
MVAMSDYQTERLLLERCTITEISQILRAASKFPNSLNKVIKKLMEVIEPAETGMIFLWNDSTGLLRPYALVGYEQEVFKKVGLQMGESLPGKVFALGHTILYNSQAEITKAVDNLRPANLDLWQQALGMDYLPKNILAAPITSRNQKHGVLVLEILDKPTDFTEQDFGFIQLIADLVSLGMEKNRLGLKDTAFHDGEQIRTEWVETLSHELSMPLTAIKGYATALLLDEVEWSLMKRQEFLQLIEAECNQMETLLSDFLNSTFSDMDQFYLEPQSLQLSQIAHKIAEEIERRTDKHHLIVDFPSNLPIVHADPRWIKQVFRNLLDNAIKYSPEGGLIVIRGEVRSTDVVISISDQGIGMPPEDLILIFDKYERGKSLEGTQIPGTGLGLPIARSIVEAHGGHIWVDSRINQGSTLSFSLPHEGLYEIEFGDRNEPGTYSDR